MEDDLETTLARIGGSLPKPADGLRAMALAGNALARPLAGLRARQTAMEAERARRGIGGATPQMISKRTAEAQGAASLVNALDLEIARFVAVPPEVKEGEAGVYGYVVAHDKPVAGATVKLTNGKRALATTESAKDGSFALTVKTDAPLRLEAEYRKLEHKDQQASYAPSPLPAYRIIVLDDGKSGDAVATGKDSEDDKAGGGGRLIENGLGGDRKPAKPLDPAKVAGIGGKTVNAALDDLAKDKIEVTSIRFVDGTDRTARVSGVTTDSAERSVTLDLAVIDRPSARLDAVAALLAKDAHASDTPLANATSARDFLRSQKVESLDDFTKFADLSTEEIAKLSDAPDNTTAIKLKRALSATARRLKPE